MQKKMRLRYDDKGDDGVLEWYHRAGKNQRSGIQKRHNNQRKPCKELISGKFASSGVIVST
jgi:hypothetical protein